MIKREDLKILEKYKLGKEEILAEAKAILYLFFAWVGVYAVAFISIIAFRAMVLETATFYKIDGVITLILSILVTWWLQKDVYILTLQELELVAERAAQEVYNRVIERLRDRYGR